MYIESINSDNADIKTVIIKKIRQSLSLSDVGKNKPHPIVNILLKEKSNSSIFNLGNKENNKGRTKNNQYLAVALFHLIGAITNADHCADLAVALGATAKKERKQLSWNQVRWIRSIATSFLEEMLQTRRDNTILFSNLHNSSTDAVTATTVAMTETISSFSSNTNTTKINQQPLFINTNVSNECICDMISPLEMEGASGKKAPCTNAFFEPITTPLKKKDQKESTTMIAGCLNKKIITQEGMIALTSPRFTAYSKINGLTKSF